MDNLEKQLGRAIFNLADQQPFEYQAVCIQKAVQVAEEHARLATAEALEKAARATCPFCEDYLPIEPASETERASGLTLVHKWPDGRRKACMAEKIRAVAWDGTSLIAEESAKAADARDQEWINAIGAEDLVRREELRNVDIPRLVAWFSDNATSGHVQDIQRLESELAVAKKNEASAVDKYRSIQADRRELEQQLASTRQCIATAEDVLRRSRDVGLKVVGTVVAR